MSSAKIPKVADIKWENIGEDLGAKMAARIKTVIVAFIFLGLCYALLFFPMIMTLKIESKEQNPNFVKLNTI